MMGHLGKLAFVVGMSHVSRLAGRILGPRWAGLITALPCSTVVNLVGGGIDHGTLHAVQMADACWVGLAAGSLLPLAFAAATVRGRGVRRAAAAAIVIYLLALSGLGALARVAGGPVIASLSVLTAATIAARSLGEPTIATRGDRPRLTPARILALRTVVPVACLSAVLTLGEHLGPAWAGVLGTFPSVTLTALLLCHLEAGPVAAVRMARALPPGQWVMVAFLASFAATVPSDGLMAGTGLGYLAALASLVVVAARLTNPPIAYSWAAQLRDRRSRRRSTPASFAPSWPRLPRRFSPQLEVALA